MKLFYTKTSPYARKPRIVAIETGVVVVVPVGRPWALGGVVGIQERCRD